MSPGDDTRALPLHRSRGGETRYRLGSHYRPDLPLHTGGPRMKTTDRPAQSRRQFLATTAGATAGMASWLALGKAPAHAQKRELTFLSWNHFVPASDDEL